MQSWIEDELATAEFGDRRLKKRAGLLLDRMGGHPQLSIPAACRGWAETAAAYRFFANEKVTAERVRKPHQDATVRRMAEQEVVLVPQDTSELDYTGHDETEGLGPLNWEERIGLFKHTARVVTPGRLSLGVVDVKIWGRREGRETDRAKVKKMPIEEKESFRWIEGYRRACDLAQQVPNTKIVSLSDREGDIYELFVEHPEMKGPTKRAEWIVRSCQDRRLTADDPTNEGAEKIRAHRATAPVLGEVEVIVARSRGREEQTVTVEIRAARVRLKPPHRTGKKLPERAVNAVWVRETPPPAGSEPLDWLLLTRLPVGTFDEAFRVVDYYGCRWQIELFFKVLKSGCEVAKPHTWRTRKDAFAEVWEEVRGRLANNPGLEAKTLFEDLQRRNPGRFADGQLRAFQRRVKAWRAQEGPEREVFFPQVHRPGELCQSDFTCMNSLGVTIEKQPFPHLMYHFVLTYSSWETGTICFSESFESLSEGLQSALWELGGVPQAHRTDAQRRRLRRVSDVDGGPEDRSSRGVYPALRGVASPLWVGRAEDSGGQSQ